MQQTASDIACVTFEGVRGTTITLGVPGTRYRLDLVLAGNPKIDAQEGRRIGGIVHARALKMHRATAGGIFIEPVEGHPRSVQGRVLATDSVHNKILAQVVVPMWISVPQGQAAADFSTGDLLNFYVDSSTSFAVV